MAWVARGDSLIGIIFTHYRNTPERADAGITILVSLRIQGWKMPPEATIELPQKTRSTF